MTKNAIVSLATKNGVYVDRLSRLSNSLRDNLNDGDFLGFIHEASVGSLPHLDNPYGFKISAIRKCIDAGYKRVLWADTSMFAVKSVQPVFDSIRTNGYFFHRSLHNLSEWCNDFTLSYFGITRDELLDYKMVHGGLIGFDFDNEISISIFNKLEQAMYAGCFKGDWTNHRHEMATLSCILYQSKVNILITPNEEVLQFTGVYNPILNTEIIFKCQG